MSGLEVGDVRHPWVRALHFQSRCSRTVPPCPRHHRSSLCFNHGATVAACITRSLCGSQLPVRASWTYSGLVAQSCLILCDPMDYSPPGPLSMEFSRQEYWSGLPYPPLGALPNPGLEPESLRSPALAGRFFIASATWQPPTPPPPGAKSYR